MDRFVGIDVSKDRLDVHILPEDEAFIIERNGRGLASLVERLKPLRPSLVVVEATGGFETVVAAPCRARLPVVIINPAQIRPSRKPSEGARKPIRSMHSSSPTSWRPSIRKYGPARTR